MSIFDIAQSCKWLMPLHRRPVLTAVIVILSYLIFVRRGVSTRAFRKPTSPLVYQYTITPAHQRLPTLEANDKERNCNWIEGGSGTGVLRTVASITVKDAKSKNLRLERGLVTGVQYDDTNFEAVTHRALLVDIYQHPEEPLFILCVVVWLKSQADLPTHALASDKSSMLSDHFQVLPADSIRGLSFYEKVDFPSLGIDYVDYEHVFDPINGVLPLSNAPDCDLSRAVKAVSG